jgi:hypothetical protein
LANTFIPADFRDRIHSRIASGEPIDAQSTHQHVIQWVILQLSAANLSFRVVNLGAGVRRIVSPADVCPCCGKKWEGR